MLREAIVFLFRGGKTAPELFKDFKVVKVFNATQPPDIGGCLKSAGVV